MFWKAATASRHAFTVCDVPPGVAPGAGTAREEVPSFLGVMVRCLTVTFNRSCSLALALAFATHTSFSLIS